MLISQFNWGNTTIYWIELVLTKELLVFQLLVKWQGCQLSLKVLVSLRILTYYLTETYIKVFCESGCCLNIIYMNEWMHGFYCLMTLDCTFHKNFRQSNTLIVISAEGSAVYLLSVWGEAEPGIDISNTYQLRPLSHIFSWCLICL